jgi:2-isopropylmalate synthase
MQMSLDGIPSLIATDKVSVRSGRCVPCNLALVALAARMSAAMNESVQCLQTDQTLKPSMPFSRYQRKDGFRLNDRTWPDKRLSHAPRWLSTDLRDGNQALPEPMSPLRKLRLFELLCTMGYKEIEIGFPTASRDDFDFVRMLIDDDLIPPGVRISVLTPAREELINDTVKSLAGASNATVSLYNATAPFFRRVVLGVDRDACRRMAIEGALCVLRAAERYLPDCELGFEYSPEVFTETEPDFALDVCSAVSSVWQPGPGREIIINFPATVEKMPPNVYADQIEWMSRHLPHREYTCLSVHPHNDRGTGVAAAELAQLAGADRVEGCLFGQGERSGNVCLVTLGMNLFSQGVDPEIDFSNLEEVRRTAVECTGIPVHPRHPYAGELVYTAFSGAHQDAIKKGFDEMNRVAAAAGIQQSTAPWDMPYMLTDPKDVGRSYEAVIRLNSQSGKSGISYIMKSKHHLDLPRGLQVEFARTAQKFADASGTETTDEQIWDMFDREYLLHEPTLALLIRCSAMHPSVRVGEIAARLVYAQRSVDPVTGDPGKALARELRAMGLDVAVLDEYWHTLKSGQEVVVYTRCMASTPVWGVGTARTKVAASMKAVLSAVIRSLPYDESRARYGVHERESRLPEPEIPVRQEVASIG